MRRALAVLVCLAACKDHPSKLDHVVATEPGPSADPWSNLGGSKKDSGSSSGDSGGLGFDLQGVLEKIKDSIDTPGPYESPKQSKDYDAEKPHWGVMGVAGDIVEREA